MLAEHLQRDFPTVSCELVLRNVLDARAVTERFDLGDKEALDIGELIARHRLLLTTGAIADVARTDPQTHHVAGRTGDLGEAPAGNESDTSIRV